MKLRSAAALLALLTPALLVNAHAQSSAAASASNFRLTLIDLDPNDGIDPSLSFVPNTSGVLGNVVAIFNDQRSHAGAFESKQQSTPWEAVSVSAQRDNGAATPPAILGAAASTSGDALATLAVHASASDHNLAGGSYAAASVYVPLAFRLSPNTALSLSFDLNVASVHPGFNAPGAAVSYVRASLEWWEKSWNRDYRTFEVSDALGTDRWDPAIGVADSGAGTRSFTVNYASGANPMNLALHLHATADTLSPVPEPHTWAMLLAGLGLVGAAGRRVRKQRSA